MHPAPVSLVLTPYTIRVGGSQNMDGSYYDAIKRYITDFGELELANCSETMVRTHALARLRARPACVLT